ncbi:COMM domain-containing protein 8 isoform X2 [Globicephala melas]|uniref:COMM domain-containing protein 8 isoform X2 n=1 Tax=Globicephala melas TaxID=9731 RepID=UPI00293D8AA3|nr:COMM domain-containing protein 8 isoform X2 [Globicephala melas]
MEPEEGVPLWRLQKLPAELGLQLLHKIIDGICGRTYPLYQDYHSVWDSTEWMHVLEDITNFFKAVVGKNLSDEEISQQLDQLNSSHQEAIMKCLKSRKDEIKQALLEEIVDISSSQLQDFDWQLKLALSSDKIATLQMPLLNLHLDVKENGEVKPYSVEMSKEELQNLINSLEAANKYMGLSLLWPLPLWSTASRRAGSAAMAHGPSPPWHVRSSLTGHDPTSPASAGGLSTTAPPWKPKDKIIFSNNHEM